ncbi:deoxynucleoside kinase [Candidatus Woesearchaeota archaeon]|nr:deoxynucleoside kinase [Candidatus Woesearchaeota archaeon]
MGKGVFIVIEGTDGSGKTVQTKKLVENLKKEGKDVETIEFPQYGNKSAGLVEEYLNGKYGTAEEVGPYRASIFFACDRYDASFKIKKWLDEGKIVIANRYTSANMGHQAGKIKDNEERDKYLKWLDNLEFNIFKIPKPDATILLFMPPEIGQKLVDKKGHREYVNGKKRDIHEADINHLKNAAEAYRYCADKFNWLVIDCAPDNELREIEDISEEILERVKEKI